ncbi:hypothetical protein AB7Z61_20280 [Providencia rettgeri]
MKKIIIFSLVFCPFFSFAGNGAGSTIGLDDKGVLIYCESGVNESDKGQIRSISTTKSGWRVSDPYFIDGNPVYCVYDDNHKKWLFSDENGKSIEIKIYD